MGIALRVDPGLVFGTDALALACVAAGLFVVGLADDPVGLVDATDGSTVVDVGPLPPLVLHPASINPATQAATAAAIENLYATTVPLMTHRVHKPSQRQNAHRV
ncbi:hypothetical protein [uncultured Jatrophihabitans sp.]|uniref:hypothetical protein n=1 Tax=uncultured Jatrophihabitans sp. TaxID=1610747 RepID=UPI0035CBAB09